MRCCGEIKQNLGSVLAISVAYAFIFSPFAVAIVYLYFSPMFSGWWAYSDWIALIFCLVLACFSVRFFPVRGNVRLIIAPIYLVAVGIIIPVFSFGWRGGVL